jgi:hypothetical protein
VDEIGHDVKFTEKRGGGLMKRKLIAVSSLTLLLAACGLPEGVDNRFYDRAVATFEEIDDDTMEMEKSDKDDARNYQLVKGSANSKREHTAAESLEAMIKLQDKVIAGDESALGEYLTARDAFLNALELSDGYDVPEFVFTEEKD